MSHISKLVYLFGSKIGHIIHPALRDTRASKAREESWTRRRSYKDAWRRKRAIGPQRRIWRRTAYKVQAGLLERKGETDDSMS